MPSTPASPTARARVRAELTREIADAARAELAEVGPAALSLRAVARRVGMAPSALYRYYASRDHLLTGLIIDAYDSLAAVATEADHAAPGDPGARWMAIGRALRAWASGHPHEWALVFGSPVPGFVGSDETTAAALHLHRVPITLLATASAAGELGPAAGAPLPAAVTRSIAPMVDLAGVPAEVAAAGLAAWGQVLGLISLERFGHLVGAVDDSDAWFDHALVLAAGIVGLRVSASPPVGRSRRPRKDAGTRG